MFNIATHFYVFMIAREISTVHSDNKYLSFMPLYLIRISACNFNQNKVAKFVCNYGFYDAKIVLVPHFMHEVLFQKYLHTVVCLLISKHFIGIWKIRRQLITCIKSLTIQGVSRLITNAFYFYFYRFLKIFQKLQSLGIKK